MKSEWSCLFNLLLCQIRKQMKSSWYTHLYFGPNNLCVDRISTIEIRRATRRTRYTEMTGWLIGVHHQRGSSKPVFVQFLRGFTLSMSFPNRTGGGGGGTRQNMSEEVLYPQSWLTITTNCTIAAVTSEGMDWNGKRKPMMTMITTFSNITSIKRICLNCTRTRR